MATKKAPEHEPNIVLAARSEPLGKGRLQMGMEDPDKAIVLPDEEAQAAGWYEERASELVQMFPGRFKLLKAKGE